MVEVKLVVWVCLECCVVWWWVVCGCYFGVVCVGYNGCSGECWLIGMKKSL